VCECVCVCVREREKRSISDLLLWLQFGAMGGSWILLACYSRVNPINEILIDFKLTI